MSSDHKDELSSTAIVDTLYDIALDPRSLENFIETWTDAGLDRELTRQVLEGFDEFDTVFHDHISRADTFLRRDKENDKLSELTGALAPFESLAAFVVDRSHQIVAANDGSRDSFGLTEGASLAEVNVPVDTYQPLLDALNKTLASPKPTQSLLKVGTEDSPTPIVFQIRQLPERNSEQGNLALVVTTKYHWNTYLGETLEEVFALTSAEQGIVRALVEGRSAKEISADRGTSEGTVRGQIKTVLSKMNARTQSEIIRLVMTLRDVSPGQRLPSTASDPTPSLVSKTWWRDEVWKPYQTLIMPDGRRMDYHVMGPATGSPVLYSHMGYCLVRWHEPMVRMLYDLNLRIICPIRAGYGNSENLDPKADVRTSTRNDTLFLLQHLGVSQLPYLTQGNDLIFATDFATHNPEMVSEIIGLCARPPLPDDYHYANMGIWHRFFLSTARHAPHLLRFTTKAAVSMGRRIGSIEMFRQMNKSSPSDMILLEDEAVVAILKENGELIAGPGADITQAYTMEILATEAPWSDLMRTTQNIKTWFVNGGDDPATDMGTIAEYRDAYPWIDIEVVPNAGQLMIYQHYKMLLPRIAVSASRSMANSLSTQGS